MDVACPSLPLNVLTSNVTNAELRPVRRHTPRMAADGCHWATCSLYVLLVIIEIFFLTARDHVVARIVLYKTGPPILSRTFCEKIKTANPRALASITLIAG